MSHELRTPLFGILGYSEILKNTLSDPDDRESAKSIHDAGSRLLALVNDVLDISRIETGQVELTFADHPLEPLLRELGTVHGALAEKKGLSLHLHLAGDLPATIHTDARRLRQILDNLLQNAIKFTSSGSVSLSAGVAGSSLEFRVSDTGPGIPSQDRPMLFKRFGQSGRTDPRVQEGAGLGLALARDLLAIMGGSISLDSTSDHGSTFIVRMPLHDGRK